MEPESERPTQRRIATAILTLAVAVAWMPAGVATAASKKKDIFGWVEWVEVGDHEISLKAKLDTGAGTSSLDATQIRRLRRRSTGKRFVEFTVIDPKSREEITLKKPLVRLVRIKQHDGSHQIRPVVALTVCLGDHLQEIEVSLIDRSEFNYPFLLGRSALQEIAVIDPELTFTTEPDCEDAG